MADTSATNTDMGSMARSPFAIPPAGWKQILLRTWKEAGDDNIGLIAAGVAFYAFLSIVPLLGAIVLIYGIVADPSTVNANVAALTGVMPRQVAELIGQQLLQVVTTSADAKGWGLLFALAIALYGAMNGAGAVITALNIAYEEHEDRGFVMQKLLALAVTVGAVMVALGAMLSVAAMAFLDSLIPDAPRIVLTLLRLLSYVILAGMGAAAAATLYRYGPDRRHAKWVWLTPGSLGATLIWLAMTVGFGFYVANFGSYDATYGSLGAIVVMLTWLSLSAYVFLLGAELNAELEHHTEADTTVGADRPVGQRGAAAADSRRITPPTDAAPVVEGPAKIALVPTLIAATGLAVGRRRKLLGTALMGTAYALTRRR
ncbi:YihY/virulence factor BrkB family protein [Sphingomonas mollis]|nr:YihY/virulence factor BrkB family protein [Sphingomonas sp. BT553]